jgi:hypothetical protein
MRSTVITVSFIIKFLVWKDLYRTENDVKFLKTLIFKSRPFN